MLIIKLCDFFSQMILSRKEEQWECSLPDEPPDKPPIRVPNKHIIPADAIIVNKELGTGEFGVVQQGVWTNDGERVRPVLLKHVFPLSFLQLTDR